MFIIALSGIFGYGIPFEHIPQLLTEAILTVSQSKYLVLGIILLFLVILGMFIDVSVVILLFTPIFLPLRCRWVGSSAFRHSVLHNHHHGELTPPVGWPCMRSARCWRYRSGLHQGDVAISHHCRLMVAVLVFVPQLVLLLPNLMFG